MRKEQLEPGFFPREEQLGAAKKVFLTLPFSETDVTKAINGMKSDSGSALGSMGSQSSSSRSFGYMLSKG
jgi:hypothetical protein